MIKPYDCPAGFYCPLVDDSSIGNIIRIVKSCPSGTYSPYTGNTQESDCIKCPEGKYCTGGRIDTDGNCSA
jgi:hypothetical protein